MELIVRTYWLKSIPYDYDTCANTSMLPGSIEDKINCYFHSTEAYRILDDLDIVWKINTFINYEIVFAMTTAQYTLWRCANGDSFCHKNIEVQTTDKNPFGAKINAALAPLGFTVSYVDGMINFIRGPIIISLYPTGEVRFVKWPHTLYYKAMNEWEIVSLIEPLSQCIDGYDAVKEPV